ncbi:MAG: 30S ribosomal protein S6 [Candidatus Liptonbacteria bacterium]|nr:30S ribosomal protein S6 [Candidatus Liptonbacteria bacterium]
MIETTVNSSEKKRKYRISVFLRQESDFEVFLTQLKKFEAVILETGNIFETKFAYPVAKQNSAYLVHLVFEVYPEQIQNIQKELFLNQNILRFLITVLPGLYKVKVENQTENKVFDEFVMPEEKPKETEIEKLLNEEIDKN